MSTPERDNLFPAAYGHEAEHGLIETGVSTITRHYLNSDELESFLANYLPSPIRVVGGEFLDNGFCIYNDMNNYEVCTPECASPDELVVYMRAGEQLMEATLRNFGVRTSRSAGEPYSVRRHNRVADSHESYRGSHDNFDIAGSGFRLGGFPTFLMSHLVTRSFVSGAGRATGQELQYAQKIDALKNNNTYSSNICCTKDNEQRLEVRCSDANISDWATRLRIGSTGLALALSQTPLTDNATMHLGSDAWDEFCKTAWRFNELRLDPDGTINAAWTSILAAVDFQQTMAELAIDKLDAYTDIPLAYREIAAELYAFCEDYRQVLNGQATISLLADRADWAAKFEYLLGENEAAGILDSHGTPIGQAARRIDLAYDLHCMKAQDGVVTNEVHGSGYRKRERGGFRYRADETAVAAACYEPPTGTRAALRSALLRNLHASEDVLIVPSWRSLEIHTGTAEASPPKPVTINLGDVTQTVLPPEVLQKIKSLGLLKA